MRPIARDDTSILGRWWWTVDHWTLFSFGLLTAFGLILTVAASPPVAERIGLDPFYFVRRQAWWRCSIRAGFAVWRRLRLPESSVCSF